MTEKLNRERLNDLIDTCFPKGSKKRGEVLAIQAIAYCLGLEEEKSLSHKAIWKNGYEVALIDVEKIINDFDWLQDLNAKGELIKDELKQQLVKLGNTLKEKRVGK